jgi:hypothetical protein
MRRTAETAQECNTHETLETLHDELQRQDKGGRAREAKDERENEREKKAQLKHGELRKMKVQQTL